MSDCPKIVVAFSLSQGLEGPGNHQRTRFGEPTPLWPRMDRLRLPHFRFWGFQERVEMERGAKMWIAMGQRILRLHGFVEFRLVLRIEPIKDCVF